MRSPKLGAHKSAEKWQSQLRQRGWTLEQINEAITTGKRYPAPNYVNQGNTATRYVSPRTGRSWLTIKPEKFCMLAQQNTNTDAIVYVRLLDEGTDVWRPVSATALPDGTFQLAEPEGYDPEAEVWEFPPHAKIKCAQKRFADGEEGLAAVAYAQ